MKKTVKIQAGVYHFYFNNTLYAIATKCKDNTWRYDDMIHTYYFDTLAACKNQFSLYNWSSGKYKAFPWESTK